MPTKHIRGSEDLQTKHDAIREGFLLQALQKSQKATPFVERAKEFHAVLKNIKSLNELLALEEFRDEIVAASGFSDKSKARMTEAELTESVRKVLQKVIKNSADGFREEILYRYLLTKGDALGGSMRNLTGASAGEKITGIILSKLKQNKKKAEILTSKSGKIQRIIWKNRVLMLDATPKIIGKNIDVILLNSINKYSSEQELLENPKNFIACGELKGGIDPADADEHWKTANSALERIRTALGSNCPKLFFIGAAIEVSMAKEIFSQLSDGRLSYVANLTNEKQLDKIAEWLVSL